MAAIKDQIYFLNGALVELGFAASRSVTRDSPQGPATYIISPEGRSGNYFADLSRRSSRYQWVADLFLPAFRARGTHQVKLGADIQRTGFDQTVGRHDYRILRLDGSLARHVRFAGNGLLNRKNFESALYIRDHWAPREGLVLELGLRAERDQIVRGALLSPRLAAAWSPAFLKGTKVGAGFGIFSDPLNLEVLTRHQDQFSISAFQTPDGSVATGPVQVGFLTDERSLKTPRARIYSLSLERMLPYGFHGKASYLRRAGWNGFAFLPPAGGMQQSQLWFSLQNLRRDRYDALEFTARRTFSGQFEWAASYTHSRARSNALVDYGLENPILGPQGGGPLGWDTPHRFLTWGWAPVPASVGPDAMRFLLREVSVAYLLEARSGFPFSVVNQENFLVGPPNQRRLPSYFNINLHFEKKFRFLHYMWAWRFGLNNLTNHGNPNVVNNNIDSPFFLTYGRGQQRAWNVRLRFLGRR
ncbi:MAG: hypothetical protein EHM65_09500 [Acidobacteriales bacterium]|nr:MAG: hypothetical protein EHM65_09500 [Terriglobales bacterium]